jgi:integrase
VPVERFDADAVMADLERTVREWRFSAGETGRMVCRCEEMVGVLADCAGVTVQDRWDDFETRLWPDWAAGRNRIGGELWRWGTWALILTRAVRPSWAVMATGRVAQWLGRLPDHDPLIVQAATLGAAVESLDWVSGRGRELAVSLGVKVLLVGGHYQLDAITDHDLAGIPATTKGQDALDAALCRLGILARTPKRGITRRRRVGRLSPAQLVAQSRIPDRFRPVTVLYLETYAARISDVYATLRHKETAIAHFWRYVDQHHPDVGGCADLTPGQARGFVTYAIERARLVRRGAARDDGDTTTAHAWLTDVRCFFADVCTWAAEPGSPFAGHAPAMVPLTRHDLVGVGFEQARRRSAARMAATVIDLEREMPNIRAFALRRWHDSEQALCERPDDAKLAAAEADAFWDWALLELLVLSGLRIEEACELTTLDILKRRQADGRTYYLLHVKPSKFDRARVIPIGDGLGHVLAEIIRHVKRFYGAPAVPACDHWDHHEGRARPRAPYLHQGHKHPSAFGITTIRTRLARLSRAAGARRADGTALVLRPHDCRRVFASEHLNNHTPPHVIQALLGHATIDTVMVYAKLYPAELVEGYRRALRGTYITAHGPDALRNPTAGEWAAFSASCSMRDMGTHLCALPAGEHCPKGLVCLGCVHAQPKKSAAPVFRRMLASHRRALTRAEEVGEPAGQIAARELEVQRIEHALRRAEELTHDVAAAIEAEAGADSPAGGLRLVARST